ncbi:hypothetical protein [Pseudanabaena mucicola]|uniref:DUF4359 domain-containing protein n=1 Tax=Pseudanabaena mucicola FACHB-723 TaxID=2692860 RepID=A0ABR7ZU08_9CYAN|nr:hypothetical protein [Pseudanabaena mucicola]MBD2187210.1 hypothetical protein [Pseudanabaena mucicola FACHB-723]
MLRQSLSVFASLIAISAFSLPAFAEVPSVYNSWKKEVGSNKACLDKASKALNLLKLKEVRAVRGGFTGRTNQSIASIACIPQNGEYIIFVSIASNNDAQARELRENLKKKL